MPYTHDFEIQIDGISIAGEITFDHGEEAKFATTDAEEMTITQHAGIQRFLEALVQLHKQCAGIDNIEVTKK